MIDTFKHSIILNVIIILYKKIYFTKPFNL